MAWPTLKSPDWSSGDVLTAADINTLLDALQYLESHETYTPTLTGSSSNPSYTVTKAVFQRFGDWGHVMAEFSFTAAGSGTYNMTLPAGWTLVGTYQSMTGAFFDTTGPKRYPLIAREGTSNTLAFTICEDSSELSSSNPVTVASGDTLSVGAGVLYLGS